MITDQIGTYLTRSRDSKIESWKENALKRLFLYSHTFSKILLLALNYIFVVYVCVCVCVCGGGGGG